MGVTYEEIIARYDDNAPTAESMIAVLEAAAWEYNYQADRCNTVLAAIKQRVAAGKGPTKAQCRLINDIDVRASKFLGGHGDALGGIVCGRSDLVEQVFHYREINGAALGAFAAYLLSRGLKTLDLRVERHNRNALAIAHFLEAHDAVEDVFYPGLESHPNHGIAVRQMRGFGGMLSFTLRLGVAPTVGAFLEKLQLAHLAASLGHVETLAGIPATTSHVECSHEQRAAMGIPEALIRYSAGIEDTHDLIADLDAALVRTRDDRPFAAAVG